jgi:hypothetical protein
MLIAAIDIACASTTSGVAQRRGARIAGSD